MKNVKIPMSKTRLVKISMVAGSKKSIDEAIEFLLRRGLNNLENTFSRRKV